MLAAEVEPDRPEGRRSPRAPVSLDARIGRGGLERALCRVVDLSVHGARLQTWSALRRGAMVRLTMPTIGSRAATVVWADDFLAGCQFADPLDPSDFEKLLALDETLRRDSDVSTARR